MTIIDHDLGGTTAIVTVYLLSMETMNNPNSGEQNRDKHCNPLWEAKILYRREPLKAWSAVESRDDWKFDVILHATEADGAQLEAALAARQAALEARQPDVSDVHLPAKRVATIMHSRGRTNHHCWTAGAVPETAAL